MKNKKGIVAILSMLLVLCLTGCGFSVGNTASKESYEDLFPDRAEAHKNKNKMVAYNFSLDGYGSMVVHVDKSEGHDFVLQGDRPGFDIVDADGNVVLNAGIMTPEAFKGCTEEIRKVDRYDARIVNGQKFECCYYGDGSDIDAYIYLADFGIDAGLVLETKGGEDAISLVAFRGEPVESSLDSVEAMDVGSLSNPEDMDANDNTFDEPDSSDTVDSSKDSGSANIAETNNVNITDEALSILTSLPTDYNKIHWGVRYAPLENTEGFIISVAPYFVNGDYCLLVGFTNITSETVAITASGTVKGTDEEIYVYEPALGKANTIVISVNCGENIVDGSIAWDEIELKPSDMDEYNTAKYVSWEADWDAKSSDFGLDVNYSVYSANDGEEATDAGPIYFVVLDSEGDIIDVSMDFPEGGFTKSEKASGSVSFYLDENSLTPAGVAMFANPKSE